MKKHTYLSLSEEIIKKEKRPLNDKEIWDFAKETDAGKGINRYGGKTPWRTINSYIYGDMKTNPNTKFIKIGNRPDTRFFLKELFDGSRENKSETFEDDKKVQVLNFNERDLHPLLVKFIRDDSRFKAYGKTIFHECSKKGKKGENEWLHPDIVGVYFPFEDYQKETVDFQKTFSINTVKLFSFEMKIKVTLSDLRQSYFQAVSNSSWANEGYLVCLDIVQSSEFLNELERLNKAFGIGIIKLNPDNVYQSEILFSSAVKNELDMNTVDRLVSLNNDFKNFMDDIVADYSQTHRIRGKYDKVLNEDEIREYVNKKGLFQDLDIIKHEES